MTMRGSSYSINTRITDVRLTGFPQLRLLFLPFTNILRGHRATNFFGKTVAIQSHSLE